MTILWLVGAWLTGVGLALTYGRSELATGLLFLAALGFAGWIITRKQPRWRLVFACGMFAALGGWRALVYPNTPAPDQIGAYNDHGTIEFIGVVDDYPDIRDNAINLRIAAQSMRENGKTIPISGTILIQVDRFTSYRYGDQLEIKGAPLTPARFDTFSYRDYLARTGVYSVMYRPLVRLVAHDQGNPIMAASFNLRERLYHQFNQWLPAPQSALFNGILLGLDNDLPQDIKQAFQDTGTSHIIAISGANVAVVAGSLLGLFGRMRQKWLSTLLIVVGIGWYACFVGTSASVVRAAITVGLAVMAENTGRKSLGLASLAFTVFVQTAINPLLIADGSLILSSLGTLGILLYSSTVRRLFRNIVEDINLISITRGILNPKTMSLEIYLQRVPLVRKSIFGDVFAFRVLAAGWDAVFTTMAAQIVLTPAIWALFGRAVSFISIPANALVVPAQGPLMELGIFAIAFSLVFPLLGQLLAWVAMIPVSFTLFVVRLFGNWSSLPSLIEITPGMIITYYVGLFALTWYFSQPVEFRKLKLSRYSRWLSTTARLGAAAIAVLVWAIVFSRPDGKLHVWFLDVGDEDAALIQTPGGATILIDGGENPSRLRTAIGDRLPFYQQRLDLHILTETRRSSLAAIVPLLDRYSIQMAVSGAIPGGSNVLSAYRQNFRGEWLFVQDEQTITIGDGLSLQWFNLAEDAPLALLLTYHDSRFLFAPNLSAEQLDALNARNLSATVIQLSPRAQDKVSPAMLQALSPQLLVMTTEGGTRYPTAKSELVDYFRTVPVYRTAERGAIHLVTDGYTLSIQAAR